MILFSSEIFVVLFLWLRHLLVTLLTAIVFKSKIFWFGLNYCEHNFKSHNTVYYSQQWGMITYAMASPFGKYSRGDLYQGGTDLEKGYGDVRPWRPPFHASPVVRKGPISSKRISSQDPLLRKFGNFSLYSLNFCQNFSSQAPKFGNFSSQAPKFGKFKFTSPQIWKVSVHKPPLSEASTCISSQAPHFRNRAAHPYLKKVECPPQGPISPSPHDLQQNKPKTIL